MGTPNSRSFLDVHTTISRQHAEIRARLRGLDAAATGPSASPLALMVLRIALLRLAVLFESHLAFEEDALGPRLRELDAWGPEREALMRAEHAEQRLRLQRACAVVEDEETGALDITREVSWLVVTLLEDMAREERELQELAQLEEYGHFDQMTG
jgi:hypothetical protein